MTIEVDEDFLFALLDFSKFEGATGQDAIVSYVSFTPSTIGTHGSRPVTRSALTDEPEGIPEPKGTSTDGDVYFEVLHLQPIQLDLSFMRTDRVNVDQKSVLRSRALDGSLTLDFRILSTKNPLYFLINALTMALGNVNDAPVRLNALVIENVRLSLPVLQERLTLHYYQGFRSLIYRVLGSADFLGNPIGLFTNVSSGVQDFFVQPYDSVMLNGSKDLGIGIARGAGSLAKKTVFGLSDGLTKITGSIGKGSSSLLPLYRGYTLTLRDRSLRCDVGQGISESTSNATIPKST